MNRIIVIALCLGLFVSCAANQPTEPKQIIMTIDGASEVVFYGTHPCEGNWNFCDQVMRTEKLIIPGEYDEYGSYLYPEF